MTIGSKLRSHSDRYLCVCQGGNVRSAALATRLKQYHRREALAVGYQRVSPDTWQMLCQWATVIAVMMPDYADHVPVEYRNKVQVCDVGEDRYGSPQHADLLAQVKVHAARLTR